MAKAVGIDLGTTNSVIAVWEGGEPTVVPNAEGSRTTPSVVAFSDDGERLVGQLARRQSILNPKGTITSAKRFIGRRYGEISDEAKAVSFDVVEGPGGVARFEVKGKQYAPEEISAQVLRKLVDYSADAGLTDHRAANHPLRAGDVSASTAWAPVGCSAAGLAIRPGDVVDCEPWFAGHGRRRDPGERHDLAMQVGLVGVTAVGRDSGCAVTRGQAMGGAVETDKRRSALGRQPDLRMEPGPQAFAAPSDFGGQPVDPEATATGEDSVPGPIHLRIYRRRRPKPAAEQRVGHREPLRPR